MVDPIDRQATINALNKTCDRICVYSKKQRWAMCGACPLGCAFEVIDVLPTAEPQWIPCSERLPSKEERKEWIDNYLDGIGYLYPCLVTRYSSINPDRTENNPYVAKHYFDGDDFLDAGEEVCSEYVIAWMPLPKPYTERREEHD